MPRPSFSIPKAHLLTTALLLAVLFGAVMVAADPATRLKRVRDAERREEARALLFALEAARLANAGAVPAGLDAAFSTFQMLGTAEAGCAETCGIIPTEEACLDLSTLLPTVPKDPSTGTSERTGYAINRTAAGRLEVVACGAEASTDISLAR